MEILFTSIVAAALAMAQRGSPANLEFCSLFSNGSFGVADGCKSRPTISAMGAERGVPKARCQPGPDFSFSQVISHRRYELIENVGVNFVEGIVIQSREIIAVRKFRGTFSISPRTVEKSYDRPKRGGRRNRGHPQK